MSPQLNRREFVTGTALSAIGVGMGMMSGSAAQKPVDQDYVRVARKQAIPGQARVALVKGDDRRKNMLKALEMIEPNIRQSIGTKQVVIKPNFTRVKREDWLASTHVDSVWAICEILSSFYKGKIIIAEGTGPGTPLEEALISYEYLPLRDRYNVEFFDLRMDDYVTTYIIDKNYQSVALRTSKLLLNPNSYIISAACLKTHSLAVITLGLKNIVMAAPMNTGPGNGDRAFMHKDKVFDDPRPFNFNLFQMATHVMPDLVTIDGFIGMEGNGPLSGTAVESNLAIASVDCLAADRVGAEVMGFDFRKIGYLRQCAEANMGVADITKIELPGDPIGSCYKKYTAPPTMEKIVI